MAKMNVRTGDQVEVLSGKDKGVRGEVIKAMPKEGKVVVRGVAMVKKAQRPTQANPQGGITTVEAPIHVSNVMLVCPACKQPTRVNRVKDENGKKVRVCKKCGKSFE